tara:strand:- start:288 stop:533 length:246 start_codon:yes stop_codon:yes gene_type:complete
MDLFTQNTHKKSTKTGKVLEHLQREGNITTWEAIQLYRATRLSAIIFNLKKEGHNISTTNEKGDGVSFTRYHYNFGDDYNY